MFKFAVVFLIGVCLTKAASAEVEVVPILSQEGDSFPDGHYFYKFESGDGSAQEQKAEVKLVDNEPVLSVEGKFSYVDSNGVSQELSYVADETGYHPAGDLLPVAPPVPEAIARALDWIKDHPYTEPEKK